MKKKKSWKNIFPAICIPLNPDYSLNEPELRKYVQWLVGFETIDGLVCNGHTGEIGGFTREERKRIVEIVVEEVGDRVTVVSGVSAEGTAEAIEYAMDVKAAGADGILLMPPHVWLRFGMKKQCVVDLFTDVAKAVGPEMGIVVHLYPSDAKASYSIDTILELCKIPSVKSIKMGQRNMSVYEQDIRILREKAPHVTLLSCHDEFWVLSCYPGVDGGLIGFASCIPEAIEEAWKALKAGDFPATRAAEERIYPVRAGVYALGQPGAEAHARMKEALRQRGIFSNALMRKPTQPLEKAEKEAVREGLKKGGFIQ